ncbi:unnamed protein product [Linum trigynum]|uniref:Uncharacterized protein n=1 Tax=Linum trigynum TaxID=586398 RepID=A0AAV2D5D5_9ROSI
MAIPNCSTIANKLVVVLLLIIILPCHVLLSSASRVVSPKSGNGNDAPTNDSSNNKNLLATQELVAKRGTGVVMRPKAEASNNATASVEKYCDAYCNDYQCQWYHRDLCYGQDAERNCKVGCVCDPDYYNYCDCLCDS